MLRLILLALLITTAARAADRTTQHTLALPDGPLCR